MSLRKQAAQKIAEWRATAKGRTLLTVADPTSGWAASITADRRDEIACTVWEIDVRAAPEAAHRRPPTLRAWADHIAAAATGLLESLRVIEVDREKNQAMLRSDSPAESAEGVAYYEVILDGMDRATVRRFSAGKPVGARREQIAFPLTHEAITKLIGDIALE